VDEGQVLEVTHHDIDVLRWAVCRVDLTGCETHDECLDRVRQAFEDELGRADGRPIAVRLVLEGTTSLHGIIHERSLHWIEEFRGIAASLIETWLEKTLFHTRKIAEKESEDGSPISYIPS
ncbi:MAG: DNA repair exonuclease, partial [Deltaproteobacteria bacterium]|nr:DNA repair exonuclease [Deltaproteobacteria bacterium]